MSSLKFDLLEPAAPAHQVFSSIANCDWNSDPIGEPSLAWVSFANVVKLSSDGLRLPPTYAQFYCHDLSAAPTVGVNLNLLGERARELNRTAAAGFALYAEHYFKAASRPDFHADWLKLAESNAEELTIGEIKVIIAGVSNELRAGNFIRFDQLLSAGDVQKMSFDAVIAILRTSFAARHELSNWGSFLDRAMVQLNSRGTETPSLESLRVAASS